MHKELMEGFSSRDHGEDVFALCDDCFHENWTFVIFEEFFHLGREIFVFGNTDGFDSHGFGQFDEIRIHLSSMRISFLIENILPLLNHPEISQSHYGGLPLEFIIEDQEFGFDIELRSRS